VAALVLSTLLWLLLRVVLVAVAIGAVALVGAWLVGSGRLPWPPRRLRR